MKRQPLKKAWLGAGSAAAAAFLFGSLAPPSYGQTAQPTAAIASLTRPPSSKAGPTIKNKPSIQPKMDIAVAPAKEALAAEAIRPFHISINESELADLRRRVKDTRWPDRETVKDQSQGVQLAKLQELVHYWGTDYDWRKVEAKLNALPQFVTTIDGVDIQFVHVRSKHKNALPLIMTHGWPGSTLELLKVIGPLTDPTAYGGRAEDAFDLVLPSYPGYGFSGKPQATDWGPLHVAQAWHQLMGRLGYKRYVAQGGDWGAIISEIMAVQAPRACSASTSTCPAPCRRMS
jgi:hypothetical protein